MSIGTYINAILEYAKATFLLWIPYKPLNIRSIDEGVVDAIREIAGRQNHHVRVVPQLVDLTW